MGDFQFGKDFLSPAFLLFGRRLEAVPPFPLAGQIVKFDGTIWELATGGILSAVQSSSNVGAGAGLALPRVGDDLPFKSIIGISPIIVTSNPTDVTISVGLGFSKTIMANSYEHESPADTEFLAVVGISTKAGVENDRHTVMPNAFTLRDLTVEIQINTSAQITNLNLRINAVNGNLSVSIPAGLTGTFTDGVNTDAVVQGDLIDYQVLLNLGSAITFDSASMVVLA